MERMLNGAHAPNAPFTEADYDRLSEGAFQSVKLMHTDGTQHDPRIMAVIETLSPSTKHFIYRLPDSRLPDGNFPLANVYAGRLIQLIWTLYQYGVRWFSICNEPNWMWTMPGYGPWQYQFFMRIVMSIVRPAIPSDVRLISPPLSFSPALWHHDPPGTPPEKMVNPTSYILDDWIAAYNFRGKDGDLPRLPDLFDDLGATVYWQKENQLHDESFGGVPVQLYRRWGGPGKSVVALEFACTAQLLINGQTGQLLYTQAEVEAIRRVQYPAWLSWMRGTRVVSATYVYLLPGATDEWKGDRLERSVAIEMSAYNIDQADNTRVLGHGRQEI